MLAVWGYVESDFRRDYGIRLSHDLPRMSWREFKALLDGLSPFGAVATHYESALKEQRRHEHQGAQGQAAAQRFWGQITSIRPQK